ncbi:hypothetical protein [Corynebacterium phoceense]|uniref:hypothetical protein n=1 Tax=Corynebacterium phoceense TaxID=1686286 RepID=UPI0030F610A0
MPIDIIERGAINNRKFFVCTEVVTDIAVVDSDVIGDFALDGNDYSYGVPTSGAEDFASFLAGLFAGCTLVTAKVVHVDVVKLIC